MWSLLLLAAHVLYGALIYSPFTIWAACNFCPALCCAEHLVLSSDWPVGGFLWETYPEMGLLDHRPVNFLESFLLRTQKMIVSHLSPIFSKCQKVSCLDCPSF